MLAEKYTVKVKQHPPILKPQIYQILEFDIKIELIELINC